MGVEAVVLMFGGGCGGGGSLALLHVLLGAGWGSVWAGTCKPKQ